MFNDSFMPPGVTILDSSLAWGGTFGRPEWQWNYGNKRISGAARDAGNTPTTTLRAGLLMGCVTSGNLWKEWNPSGTDGSQWLRGILLSAVDTQRGGSNQNRFIGNIAQFGAFKGSKILIPGEADYGLVGKDLEFMVRNAFTGQFRLDDFNQEGFRQITIATSTTLDYTYHNAVIDNIGAAGAVTLTLPTPRRGFRLRIIQQGGQNIVLNSSASNEFIPQSGTPATSITIASTVYGMSELVGLSTSLYSINVDDIV
jgi:hypothetical protein